MLIRSKTINRASFVLGGFGVKTKKTGARFSSPSVIPHAWTGTFLAQHISTFSQQLWSQSSVGMNGMVSLTAKTKTKRNEKTCLISKENLPTNVLPHQETSDAISTIEDPKTHFNDQKVSTHSSSGERR
jgi:hypothetical protein